MPCAALPIGKAQYQRLTKTKQPHKAIVAIARRLLVSAWHILTKREPYRHFDDENIADKLLTSVPLAGIWSWKMDEQPRQGLSRPQCAKYGCCAWAWAQISPASCAVTCPGGLLLPLKCSGSDPI